MAKIYRVSDRIPVKIDDIVITISPLTFEQKTELQSVLAVGDIASVSKAAKLAVKYAVKDIDNIEDSEGNPYKINFDDSGVQDDSLDDLFNLDLSDRLMSVCISLLNGIPKGFVDPNTGKAMKGVSYVKKEPAAKKKKAAGS